MQPTPKRKLRSKPQGCLMGARETDGQSGMEKVSNLGQTLGRAAEETGFKDNRVLRPGGWVR